MIFSSYYIQQQNKYDVTTVLGRTHNKGSVREDYVLPSKEIIADGL